MRKYRQREFIKLLAKKYDGDREKIVNAYVRAEEEGQVERWSNENGLSVREYASRLISDGLYKGWLQRAEEAA